MAETVSSTAKRLGRSKPQRLIPPDETLGAPEEMSRGRRVIRFIKGITPNLGFSRLFFTPAITEDTVNDMLEVGRFDRSIKTVTYLNYMVSFLGCVLAFGTPFFAPLYIFHAITPEGRVSSLVPLDLPNLTNPAVVDWSATAVTEVMSFGFGDIDAKTLLQRQRFTKLGWDVFVKAFLNSGVYEQFKKNQIVMTTVPREVPIIMSQGINEEGVYEWKVEIPVITTFAANNNVVKPDRTLVRMTIIRVPYDVNPTGIAIDIWHQIKQ